jgi:lysophospholipase L1-like esterase
VYRDAMKQLVARLLEDGAQQVLLVIPPPQYHDMPTQKRIFAYRAELEALCGADGDAILCGPDAFLLLQPDDFASGDPHPNGQGHRKLADALRPAIAAALAAR